MFISCFIGLLATVLFNFISQRIDLKKENNINFDNIKFDIDNIDFDINKAFNLLPFGVLVGTQLNTR